MWNENGLLIGLIVTICFLCVSIFSYRKAPKRERRESPSVVCPHCGQRLTPEEVLDLQIGLQ